MQKIRCPRCGVVNLEKFVTFPQCAGCGNALPAVSRSSVPFWRRPLGAFLWVSVIGISIAGLVASTSFLTAPYDNRAQIVIYGSASRRVAPRQTVIVVMTIDAVAESELQQRSPLRNVKLRLPRSLFEELAFVSLEPHPDMSWNTKSGRYFQFNSLSREAALRLRLYALKAGEQRVRADFYADDHLPGSYAVSIAVSNKPILRRR